MAIQKNKKEIRLVRGNVGDEKLKVMIEQVCERLFRCSKKNWSFKETKKQGGELRKKLGGTCYILSKNLYQTK